MVARDERLEVHLFGGFSVQLGREPLPPLPSRVARLLVSYLMLHAGRPQPRTVLVDRFWPDVPEARGRRRLSHVLWQMQDALAELAPGRVFVQTPRDMVVFDGPDPYWLDVEEFESRLDRVDTGSTLDARAERELRRCVELYRGDLLAGYYEPWVIEEQARLEHRYLTALGHLVEACKQQGNFHDALTFARRVTHQAPLREDGHREVMRLSVLLGQSGQAMEQYERCRSVLAEELDTEPDAETQSLFDRITETRTATASPKPRPRELVSERLVGRESERVALVDRLELALGGRSGTVFVEGPPGVGKSQLVRQLADDARWRGFTVMWGDCTESTSRLAYAAVREALESELQPVRAAQLRHSLDPVWLREAAWLLPTLGVAASDPSRGESPERAELMREALSQLLLEMSARQPTLLVIEDLQWADEETLALLSALARRRHQGRLLLVVTFRDYEARDVPSVWSELRAVDRDARPERIMLGALTAFETSSLVADVLGPREVPASFVAGIQRESGGNPLYVLELLRAMRDSGSLTSAHMEHLDVVDVPVTSGLRTLIANRLRDIDPAARQIVELGATLGTEFALDTLAAGCALSPHELNHGLARLSLLNVLRDREGRFGFTHAVTRRIVLGDLPPARAQQLHRRAAEALEETDPDRVEALATHFMAAGQPRKALTYLTQATQGALDLHAYATAALHLATASEAIDQVPASVDERYALLVQHERILDVLGRRDEQESLLDQLGTLAASDRRRHIEVLLRQASYLGHVDRFEEASLVAAEAQSLAEKANLPKMYGLALAVSGRISGWLGDNTRAVELLRAAAATLPDDDPSMGETRFSLGTALRFLQRYDEAEHELGEALRSAHERDDQPGVVRAIGALADLHTESGASERALEEYDQAVQGARRLGYRHREAVSLVNRANLQQSQGDPGGAAASYQEAERRFMELGNRRGRAMVHLNRAWLLHRWLGDDEGACRDAEDGRDYFAAIGNEGSEAMCLDTLAAIARRRGDLPESRQLLGAALADARSADEHRAEAQIHRGLAATELDAGQPEAAMVHLDRADELADRFRLGDLQAELAALRATALLGTGQPQDAWRAARTALDAIEAALEPHRVLLHVARVAAAIGRQADAAHQIARARTLLQRGLGGLDRRQRQAAVDGVPEHRTILDMADSLLPRTVEVAMAGHSARRGRPLRPDELVTVHLRLGPLPATPGQRRDQLLDAIGQARSQDAEPTVADLAAVFEVSPSTVHRDLHRLRERGADATTRGTGVG